ncbi:MAG: glycosyl hydrolase [Thermorudis peleae]|nr:glycosyl hydrolase [Thermorudis peleae]
MAESQTAFAQLARALEFRGIGPYRGGRVVAVAGHPTERLTFYFGSTGGGVWKTTDGGRYWRNISDGFFHRASVGAIAVSEADPNVIYVGMGEACIRNNVSHGDGVYKSTDGGRTWTHCGLADTRHIGALAIHPKNPDIVYVAALGHAHGANTERGVFRSRDGGKTWERVLFRDEQTGAIDIALDPHNPRIVYAALWQAIRRPWELVSGGPGSGLFRSTDGGDTWEELSHKPGLPKGVLGKIGIAPSPAKEGRIWAIIEAEDGAVFRSDDYGETWERLSEDQSLRQRAWYYHHIVADPQDPETVWVLNVELWKSNDGGKTFFSIPTPHGDHHALWIDPHDPKRMILGDDGGASVSFDGGRTWSDIYNQPTAEIYHVTVDRQFPFRVYGAQQDNTTISIPSRSHRGAITVAEYEEVGGGESGYIAVDPRNPNIIYAGNYLGYLTRYDRAAGQIQNVQVWPETTLGAGAEEAKYRFQWTYPIVISPHDPDVLYVTSNVVHRSRDGGQSWEVISPDLTRNDPDKLKSSGGPITKDNTGAEYYCTIFAFAESPVQAGVLWAGSDDGLVHVSRDGGATWQNVTPPDLPEWATVSIIEPSPHDAATCYLAAHRYRLDDFRPLLFKTTDFGQHWQLITAGLPDDEITRAIRVDPQRPGLLFAGTETGLWVSFDDGGQWERLRGNLPVVPIHDLVITGDTLVLATHGRGFWLLDDLTPIRQFAPEQFEQPAWLFALGDVVRYRSYRGFGHAAPGQISHRGAGAFRVSFELQETETGERREILLDAAPNPPDGAVLRYFLREEPATEVTITIYDEAGNEIRRFSSTKPQPAPGQEPPREPVLQKTAGVHQVVWNLRYPDATLVSGDKSMEFVRGGLAGPLVPPGTYIARLQVGDHVVEQRFRVVRDPRIAARDADLREQFELALAVWKKLSEVHEAVNRIRTLRQQLEPWERRTDHEALSSQAKALRDRLLEIEGELIQYRAKSSQDSLNFPVRLNAKLAGLAGAIGSADARPTAAQRAVFADLVARADALLARLREVIERDIAAFNQQIRESGAAIIAGS